MSDLIERKDAIKAIEELPNAYNGWSDAYDKAYIIGALEEVPPADRPNGEVDAVKEYEHQVHNLDQGYITLGEFDKRIEPLRHLHYDRPQGEWTVSDKDSVCSVCGKDEAEFICGTEDWYGYGLSNYCPNCGARMKGADDE